jgi:hypothetical protein
MGIARGSNIITDGLVFGYDTGHNSSITGLDSQPYHNDYRFYKGVPATNLITSGLPGYFGSGGVTSYQKTMYGFTSASGVFQRNFVNNPAQANTSTYNNNAGLVHSGLSFSSLSANTEYVMISFDFYMITPYKRHSASGTGLNGYMRIQYTDGTYDSHGWNTSLAGNNGDDWNNNDAYVGKWRKIALICDVRDDKTPSAINQFYIYNDRTIQGEGVFTNFVITEHTTLPTAPVQWMPNGTTRTNTNSLIDLKGTTNVSLANISFDSKGQPEFDGSDDYIDLGSDVAISPINQGWTAEYVFNSDDASVLQHFNGAEEDTHNANWLALLSSYMAVWDHGAGVWKYGSTQFSDNTWYHIAFVQETGTSMQFYVNGVAEGGDHASFSWTASRSALNCRYVGMYEHNGGYSRRFNGHIPVVKLYDAPLTATQIKQNYNAYKKRFNI